MPRYIVKTYLDCQRCPLSLTRKKIVFGRGSLPAKILFIGEAPGEVEDLMGIPFVGPSGRVLNEAIKTACSMINIQTPPRYFITNTVACRPCDSLGGPNREPQQEEIWRCFERLQRTHADVKPKRIVFLGKVAQHAFKKVWPDAVTVYHPAYILRLGGIGCPAFRALARDISAVFQECL